MAHRTPLLLILLICIVGSVVSLPIPIGRETNAARMARGLSPLPPRSIIEARKGPTGTDSSKRPQTSPRPPVTLTGRLQVRTSRGQPIGFVKNWQGAAPISGINFLSGSEPDLAVSLTYKPSQPDQIDILATNPKFPAPFYVGASGGSSSTGPTKLQSGVKRTLAFTNVSKTLPGSLPTIVSPVDAYVESAIWSFDPTTKELKAQWINKDGSKPATILAYDIKANALFFVSDINAYNAQNSSPASAVNLFLV